MGDGVDQIGLHLSDVIEIENLELVAHQQELVFVLIIVMAIFVMRSSL